MKAFVALHITVHVTIAYPKSFLHEHTGNAIHENLMTSKFGLAKILRTE